MNDVLLPAVSVAVVLLAAIAFVRLSGRDITGRQALLVAALGTVMIMVLTALRLALPEVVAVIAVTLVGITLSAILVWAAFRYGANLPTGQTRRLLIFAVAGVVITILGAAVQLAR